MKVWDRAGIELATPGSAVRHASVARHVTDCATGPGFCAHRIITLIHRLIFRANRLLNRALRFLFRFNELLIRAHELLFRELGILF